MKFLNLAIIYMCMYMKSHFRIIFISNRLKQKIQGDKPVVYSLRPDTHV